MAKLKLLKMPKAPKLPKKPAQSASLSTKQNWIKRVADLKANYTAKVRATQKENAGRISDNKKSEQLSKVIANTTSISKAGGSFRTPARKRKPATTVKKKGAKRKAAPKKTAKRRR